MSPDYSAQIVGTVFALFALLLLRMYWKIKPLYVPCTVPGPKRYPLIGYLWHPIKYWSQWPTETCRLAKKYKRTWGGPLPNFGGLPGAYFYIHEEQNVKHILQDRFDNYGKGDMWQKVLGELLGTGIFAVDGDSWRKQRKVMSHMFSRNLLRHTATVTKSKLMEVVQLFEAKIIENNNSPDNCNKNAFNIDIQDVFFRLTIDVTAKVTFGVSLNSIQEQHHFAQAFDELSFLCQKRFLDPLFAIKRYLRLTRRERRIRELQTVLDSFAFDIIGSKRRSAEEDSSSLGPDLLSRFIDHAKRNKETISDRELRDIVMNIILAGRDTTACALSWTMFELTRHSHVVEKIIEEVHSVCGTGDDAEITYDTMSKLRYTHCVAMEVLRLHPPVTNDPRYAVGGEDTLPDGTRIPSGSGLDLCFYAMCRKEEIWGEDALEFKPERFLDSKEPSPFKYPVFNAGPRLCVGKPLALMNMKLAMSILLPRFKFVDELHHSGDYKWTLVQAMKGGFSVNVSLKSQQ